MVKTDSGKPHLRKLMAGETGKGWRKFMTSPRLEELHAECQATGRGFGNRLTEIVSRYDALMAHYNPHAQFEPHEWQRLLAILQEHWPQPDQASTSPAHVRELLSQSAPGTGLRWRILHMEPAETTALIEQAYKDLTTKPEDDR